MNGNLLVSNVEIFLEYAGKDIRKWNEIVSRKVVHILLGIGTVEKVDECVYVNYNGEIKRCVRRRFASYFSDVELPEIDESVKKRIVEKIQQIKVKELEEEIRRKSEEEKQAKTRAHQEAMKEFEALKAKYSATGYASFSPFDRLHDVLLKLETEKNLVVSDLRWLEQEKLFGVLATFYEICFSKSSDPWFLVKASRY